MGTPCSSLVSPLSAASQNTRACQTPPRPSPLCRVHEEAVASNCRNCRTCLAASSTSALRPATRPPRLPPSFLLILLARGLKFDQVRFPDARDHGWHRQHQNRLDRPHEIASEVAPPLSRIGARPERQRRLEIVKKSGVVVSGNFMSSVSWRAAAINPASRQAALFV